MTQHSQLTTHNPSPGPHLVALCATVLTWPLLLVGGSVTVYRVGMAVPDWPTTFGINMFLYRFWEASWGVFIEHGHRLYGSLVGLACIVLAAWFLIAERRAWLKALGVFALVAVIGQGVLGGYRVRLNSTMLAFVHGCSAQAFFGLMVALCVFTGRSWAGVDRAAAAGDTGHLRRRASMTLALVYGQVVLGAWVRHYGEWRAVLLHVVLATAVWGHAVALARRVERSRADVPALLPSARAMAATATAQLLLGIGAWAMLRPFDGIARSVSTAQASVRIAHQGLGALLLASTLILTLRSYRLLADPSGTRDAVRAARRLEVVA